MWNWTEMPTVFGQLRVESKYCINSASYEQRNMSDRRLAPVVSIGIPSICWKTFPAKVTKISTRNSSILMMSSSESECSFTKYASTWHKTKYLYLRLPFLKMKEFQIMLDNCFSVIVRNSCKKGGKIERLDACFMVEIWRFKIFH